MPSFVTPLFTSRPGTVGVVGVDQSLPVMIAVTGLQPGVPLFDPFRFYAIITGFEVASESGVVVSHTLNDAVRMYLYGERAQPARVSGVTFPRPCGSGPGDLGGQDRAWLYYEYLRSSSYFYPLHVYAGPALSFAGMLRGFRLELGDPVFGTGKFSFEFIAFPNVIRRVRFPISEQSDNPLGIALVQPPTAQLKDFILYDRTNKDPNGISLSFPSVAEDPLEEAK